MRVLKLLAMGLAGYAIYEIGRSLFSSPAIGGGSMSRRPSPAQQADEHRARLSGQAPGEGMRVEVAEDSGATRSQVVGRGVVSR
jgi:hypothetical protein